MIFASVKKPTPIPKINGIKNLKSISSLNCDKNRLKLPLSNGFRNLNLILSFYQKEQMRLLKQNAESGNISLGQLFLPHMEELVV